MVSPLLDIPALANSLRAVNRFLAAALLCIMQLCYAHCFAEQMGLVHKDAARCCEKQTSSSGSHNTPCKICEVIQTGGMDVQKVSFAVSVQWMRVDAFALESIVVPAHFSACELVQPTPSDGVPRASQTWEDWRCKALPVRGPTLILA